MKILENLSQLNDEGIKIKGSGEHKEQEEDNKKQNNKKKTLVISTRAKEEEKLSQLSLIKADSSEDYLESNQNKNELEISIVGPEKLKKKEKNVSEITELIKNCKEDIDNLDKIIKKYRYSTKDYIMQSGIDEFKSMICIDVNKNGENDEEDLEKKANYFNDIKKEFVYLQKKLENLLSMYNSEKELTALKKGELEYLENLNKKYKELKQLKQKKHNTKK